jgi:thymidylate kinase
MLESMIPLRISIIGIDGSGKSTTTLRAIRSLSNPFSICKTGRNPLYAYQEEISYCLPKTAKFFEELFKRVDATKRRGWIGLSRLFFVLFQGWLEPYMNKRYRPDLILTTRCMVIDSAIYSDFYYPFISQKLTIAGKLKLTQQYSRLPFRDLYFYLNTPIETAVARIHKRIADDHPEITYGRDYWLHLHEHEDSLKLFDLKFRETLKVAQESNRFKVIEIDTAIHNEEEVARLISESSTGFYEGCLFESWAKI